MEKNRYKILQEKKEHGRPDFLFNIYPCTIPLDFTDVPVHWHGDMEMISVRKGFGIVELDFEPFQISKGDLVLIRPGQLHAIHPISGISMEYENIMLDPNFMLSNQIDACARQYFIPFIEGHYQIPSIYREGEPCYDSAMDCIRHMDQMCSDKSFAWELGVKSSLLQLFYVIFSKYTYEKKHEGDEKTYETLKEILSFVDANYTHAISIEEIANEIGYSESHFMRFFKQQTNMTFVSYLNDYRLSKAAEALTGSKDSILEISGNCGYDNLSLFNRQFKRKYQMTPSAFRELYLS